MAKQIAVFMCALNLDNQRKLFDGMIKAAKETDVNLFAFTNYISYRDTMENMQGAYQIMCLPDLREFDGVIFSPNTLQYPPIYDYVVNEINRYKIPSVSIDRLLEGFAGIGIASYEAEYAMTEHFIKVHGCEEIIYVSGPQFNPEGVKRYRAYCDAMRANGLEVKQENVYEGIFTSESGQEIAKEILARKEFPKHIICANDALAVGIVDTFKEHGLRIPEDVKVAGFDNGELSEFQNPALTTVDKSQLQVGYEAVYEILAQLEGKEPEWKEIECKLEIRYSCGCNAKESFDIMRLKDRYVHRQVITQRMADAIRNMVAEFSGIETAEGLVETMKRHVMSLDIESFYLCLCDSDELYGEQEIDLSGAVDIRGFNTDYTDKMYMAMAYENREFKKYEPFYKGHVLPEEIKNSKGGSYYVAMPIYYQNCCYGYCVTGNSRLPLEYSLFFSWVVSIGIGLENVRKWLLLKRTVTKLNGMWVHDTMTKLYNRAGFFYCAEPVFREYQKADERIFVMFIDVDGLKTINDNLGHEMGDALISEMAEIIKQFTNSHRIAMRYGGDEFVIFGCCKSGETADTLIGELRVRMAQRNMQKVYSFEVKASIGNTVYRAKEMESLEQMIEIADKKMYEEKRRKREEKAKQEKKS